MTATRFSADQAEKLEALIQKGEVKITCPNHPTRKMEVDEKGAYCTQCDHKVPADTIPSSIIDKLS